MEKDLFIKVLRHYADSTSEDARDVLSLKDHYPYSQLLHALSARLAKDHGFSTQQAELQLAAVYAADRAVLKDVMTLETIRVRPSTLAPTAPVAKPVASAVATEDVAEEVLHDLERLHELRHNFEMLFVDVPASGPKKADKAEEPKAKTKPEEPAPEAEVPKDTSKSRRERIIEMARALNEPEPEPKSRKARIIEMAKALQEKEKAEDETPADADDHKAKPRKKRKDQNGEDLIEEIVSTKDEIVPESEKQKEQIEIIDQFIKSQPSITQAKDKVLPPPGGDLSSIKTGEFGDNVVSETLVEILGKQGKKDKAVEVLKKLIWKFPQKKAYFAAQIEDLRK